MFEHMMEQYLLDGIVFPRPGEALKVMQDIRAA
jgi:hypothetical protein